MNFNFDGKLLGHPEYVVNQRMPRCFSPLLAIPECTPAHDHASLMAYLILVPCAQV